MYPDRDTIPQLLPNPDVLLQLLQEKSKYITRALNVWSLGKLVSFVFPRVLMKHEDSRENKTNCFSRDHTLSVYYFRLTRHITVMISLKQPEFSRCL